MSSRRSPMLSSSLVRTLPAAPTKGLPTRSSFSPGPSPTAMILAVAGPVPGTAWVRRVWSGQAVQTRMCS